MSIPRLTSTTARSASGSSRKGTTYHGNLPPIIPKRCMLIIVVNMNVVSSRSYVSPNRTCSQCPILSRVARDASSTQDSFSETFRVFIGFLPSTLIHATALFGLSCCLSARRWILLVVHIAIVSPPSSITVPESGQWTQGGVSFHSSKGDTSPRWPRKVEPALYYSLMCAVDPQIYIFDTH